METASPGSAGNGERMIGHRADQGCGPKNRRRIARKLRPSKNPARFWGLL